MHLQIFLKGQCHEILLYIAGENNMWIYNELGQKPHSNIVSKKGLQMSPPKIISINKLFIQATSWYKT